MQLYYAIILTLLSIRSIETEIETCYVIYDLCSCIYRQCLMYIPVDFQPTSYNLISLSSNLLIGMRLLASYVAIAIC